MQDRFEKFVHENRDAFDLFEPREQLWEEVADKLRQQHKLKRWRSLSVAASVLLLVGCAIGLTQSYLAQRNIEPGIAGAYTVAAPDVRQAEYYYTSLVMTKYSELDKYRKDHPQLCNEFGKDLETLNTSYSQLKEEYNKSGNEAVLQAMIENLQMQVQLLAQQLQIIRTVDQKENTTRSM